MTDLLNNRWVRLVKDLLFVGLGLWLLCLGSLLAVFVGVLALLWYGRDAWFQGKVLWQEKHYKPAGPAAKTPSREDGKIQVNPSEVKEVHFDKE